MSNNSDNPAYLRRRAASTSVTLDPELSDINRWNAQSSRGDRVIKNVGEAEWDLISRGGAVDSPKVENHICDLHPRREQLLSAR
jgi:hypothetical protein